MPRVEGQYDGGFVDRKGIADMVERRFGPQEDADAFADILVDPDSPPGPERSLVERLISGRLDELDDFLTRLYTSWKRGRSSGPDS